MAIRPLRWVTPDRTDRMGFWAALVVPAALYVLFSLFPAGVGDDLRAVLFVSGLIAVSTQTSLPAAICCAVASFLAYELADRPAFDFHQLGATDAILLATFAALATVVARRASRTRQEVEAIRLGRRQEEARRELTEQLSSLESEADVAMGAVRFLESLLGRDAALWLGNRGYARQGRAPNHAGAVAGPNGVAIGEGGWRWLALDSHEGLRGAIGLCVPNGHPLEPSTIGLVRSLGADIVHSALRARLDNDLRKERAANESERLCTALLASVAHDLRTPLATIMASSETLRTYARTLSPDDRQGLLDNIEAEGQRLDAYIQNLVDVTQIGQGQIDMELDCLGADELVGSAITRLKRYHRDAAVEVQIEPELPALRVHGPLLEQALFNVLHNAAKFSPQGRPIRVSVARSDGGEILLDVVDEGPGIPRAERERVFDMFYSADRGGRNRSGTGLGLAISQSIVRAHGGEVRADQAQSGRGTMMRIQLPRTSAQPACT